MMNPPIRDTRKSLERPRASGTSPSLSSHPATISWSSTMNTSDRSDANDHVHDIANERTAGCPGTSGPALAADLRALDRGLRSANSMSSTSRTEPKYEAFSTLRIEPTKPELFGPAIRDPGRDNFQPYMETQRNLILTDRVLDAALADRAVQSLPMLRETDTADPKVELRKRIHVDIIPGTYLIRVSYSSDDSNEAFAVVKSVVDSFMQQHREFNLGDTGFIEGSVRRLHQGSEGSHGNQERRVAEAGRESRPGAWRSRTPGASPHVRTSSRPPS